MRESLSGWLALREPLDIAARSIELTKHVAASLPPGTPLRIVDLGTGTGSNVRYLAPRLRRPQEWLLVDRDPVLLAEASARLGRIASIDVVTREADLGHLAREIVAGRHLVTASALLDLVSQRWLESLAVRCREAGARVLFAMTYDGRSRCEPPEPEDEVIRELMNRHQRSNDQGFGRAAGPDAVAIAERAFATVGYVVERAASDWELREEAREQQRQLIGGWADAAREMAPDRVATIDDWLRRRLAHVDASRSRITVGHEDLAGWPAG